MKLGKSAKTISVVLLSSVVLAACSNNSKTTSSSTSYEQKIKKLEKQKKKLQAQVEAQEKAKAEAEKKLKEEAETATKNLENNQTNENVTPAQTAVDKITDQQLKASFQDRIDAVKNAISQREEQAKITAEQEAQRQAEIAAQQTAPVPQETSQATSTNNYAAPSTGSTQSIDPALEQAIREFQKTREYYAPNEFEELVP